MHSSLKVISKRSGKPRSVSRKFDVACQGVNWCNILPDSTHSLPQINSEMLKTIRPPILNSFRTVLMITPTQALESTLSCPTVLGTCVEAHVSLNQQVQFEAVSRQKTIVKFNSSPEPVGTNLTAVKLQRLMATLPKHSPIGVCAHDTQGTLSEIEVQHLLGAFELSTLVEKISAPYLALTAHASWFDVRLSQCGAKGLSPRA